jgi:hypothetical protein
VCLIVGSTDGLSVGLTVGFRLGTAVGAQVSKFVTVILAKFPNSTQWPTQLEKLICCYKTSSGTLIESNASS